MKSMNGEKVASLGVNEFRPDMSCEEIQRLVQENTAVIPLEEGGDDYAKEMDQDILKMLMFQPADEGDASPR